MNDSLNVQAFYRSLKKHGIDYFCGVPDSVLASFGNYLELHDKPNHDVAVNEGQAVGLAIGYHIARAKAALVYMQNSGLGNAVNPHVSLADPAVMGVPMVLLIGWRGEPGTKDEPQHAKQGQITTDLLDSLGIGYEILSTDERVVDKQVQRAVEVANETKQSRALLVSAGTFAAYKNRAYEEQHELTREVAIKTIIDNLAGDELIVVTTGKANRELFEYRESRHDSHEKDLLIVGGMGHASSIAQSIAKQKPTKKVIAIDGDGAVLMHMGALAYNGAHGLSNFCHIVMNNAAHESVGGQPTVARKVDLPGIAQASGYRKVASVSRKEELKNVCRQLARYEGPVFLEVNIALGSRADLTRPTITPEQNKSDVQRWLGAS